MRILLASASLCVLVILSGCASTLERGNELLSNGQDKAAYREFQKCAKRGNASCLNQIGYLHEFGKIGPRDKETAAAYYAEAVRRGSESARTNLRRLGEPIPRESSHRVNTPRRSATNSERAREAGYLLGCALAGSCSRLDGSSGSPRGNNYPSNSQASRSATQGTRQVAPASCDADFDCGIGEQCVKPAGTFGRGQCIREVDKYGNPTLRVPEPSVGPREVSSCSFSTDCPIGFTCEKEAGQLYGLCVK